MNTRAATADRPPALLTAVCVGRPQLRTDQDPDRTAARGWTSAIWKQQVVGAVHVHRTGIDGDEQADLRVHGGPEKAVLAYSQAHYRSWRQLLDGSPLGAGAFGENLAIDGLDETTVAIGDVWTIGRARLQVCQPRAPCWKLARKFGRQELVEEVIRTGRTGWYLRVLGDGLIAGGDAVELVDCPNPELTLARLHRLLYSPRIDEYSARRFIGCKELSDGVRDRLSAKLS